VLGRAQARERLLAPQEREDLEEGGRGRAPGERQAGELGQVDELEPELRAQVAVRALERVGGDARQRLEARDDRREPPGARLGEVRVRRLARVVTRALEVEAADLEQFAERLSALLERRQHARDVRTVAGRVEPDRREERR